MRHERSAAPRWIPSLAVVVGLLAGGALPFAVGGCGGSHVQAYAPPKAPVTQIANDGYQALLDKYVGANGKVDYGRLKDDAADVAALDGYLSMLTHATPTTRPDLFKTQTDKLSYWINLYNALVLREIIRNWPLDSVTDVKLNATGFVKSGKGFFYEREFVIGGEKLNLYEIENRILRAQFKDARVHLTLHCGSSSCPLLRKDAFDPSKLEEQLDSASTQFVNDGKNVIVDPAAKQVVMSRIFAWYNDDFVAFMRQRAKAGHAGLVDFALLYAKEPLATELKEAKAKRYTVVFRDYDWGVNQQDSRASSLPEATQGVGKPVPDVAFALADGRGSFRPSDAKGKVLLLEFWATSCKPCKGSFPKLQALHERHGAEGLVIVAIAEDDEPSAVVPAFLEETGAKFLIGIDPEHAAAKAPFEIRVLPTELLVDRNGVVRHRHEGLRDGEIDAVVKQIEALLKEP